MANGKKYIYFVEDYAKTKKVKMEADSLIGAARKFLRSKEVNRASKSSYDCVVKKYEEWKYDNVLSEAYFKEIK